MADETHPQKDEFNEQNLDSVEEEYLYWKKNTPLLYDTLVSHLLEWPALSCQYFQAIDESKTDGVIHQSFAVGTFADDQSQNYLMVMGSRIPVLNGDMLNQGKVFEHQGKNSTKVIKVDKKFIHTGEINKLRICPNQQNIIATKSENGKVYIWNVDLDEKSVPVMTLSDNLATGFALDWNTVNQTKLISGDNKGLICLYTFDRQFEAKVEHQDKSAEILKHKQSSELPEGVHLKTFENHGMAINDCRFQRIHGSLFGAVSDDCSITLWDIRSKNVPFMRIVAHINEIFTLDFSHHDEFLLLTGGGDNLVKLWDIRKFTKPIHEFEDHSDKILKVKWSPNNESLFSSSGEDKTVKLWDCSKIGNDVTNGDHMDGPPELLFTHKGHKGIVEDTCWNPHQEFGILSVDSQNILQIWEIDDKIYYDDDNISKAGNK